jgi:hypothetical protein
LSAAKVTFELVGAKESITVAPEDPVVSVILMSPSDITRPSEKYKSKDVIPGVLSHAPFEGEYGMLLPETSFSVSRVGAEAETVHVSAASVVKVKVAWACM